MRCTASWPLAEPCARACVVLDAAIETATPQWVLVLAPVLTHRFDLMAPLYRRHVRGGVNQRDRVSDVSGALWRSSSAAGCGRIRMLLAAAPPLPRRGCLGSRWRARRHRPVAGWRCGLSDDLRIGEAALGTSLDVTHSHTDETVDLGTTVTQVVGSLFAEIWRTASRGGSECAALRASAVQFGRAAAGTSFQAVSVDHVQKLIRIVPSGIPRAARHLDLGAPATTIIDLRSLA